MERFIPYRPGLEFGHGFNTATGEARGVAVEGTTQPSRLTGQTVTATATTVDSQEKLYDSLNIDVKAGMHYGLFSADARFNFAEQSSYSSQSTFVVAQCVVENAFESYQLPKLTADAKELYTKNGEADFIRSYGNCFVNGLRSGGEFYAVFKLTSSSTEQQKTVAASLQAEIQGLIGGGSLDASIKNINESTSKVDSVQISFYQRAGMDETIAPVSNPKEIMTRLHYFPKIAHDAPAGYLVQIMDYQVIPLPPLDEVSFRQREETITDCARLKMKYLSIRAEIDLIRQNKQLFEGKCTRTTSKETNEQYSFTDGDLANAYEQYTKVLNYLYKHVSKVANKEIEPNLFVLSDYDQELHDNLPMFIFIKKAPQEEHVQVPNVMTLDKKVAEDILRSQGLNPVFEPIYREPPDNTLKEVITRQVPGSFEVVPKGTTVVIEYYTSFLRITLLPVPVPL